VLVDTNNALEGERSILARIAAGVPLTEVLTDLVRMAEAERASQMLASVLFLDESGKHLLHGAAPHLPPAYNDAIHGVAIGEDVGSCGTAAARNEPVFVTDIATDPRWADFRDLALSHGLRACWSIPIRSADGRVLGTFANYYREPRAPTQTDVAWISDIAQTAALAIERARSDDALRVAKMELQDALDSAGSGLYAIATDGTMRMCNDEFLRLLGYRTKDEVVGRSLHGLIHHTHPDGSPYPASECPVLRCAQTGEAAHIPDDVYFRADGRPIPVEIWVRPLLRNGELHGAMCTCQDITERKRAEEQRTLLLRELNHRVKNLFALTNGLVALSARSARTPKEMAVALQGRLAALTRAHELVQPGLRANAEGASSIALHSLVREILAPYAVAHFEDRVRIEGPDLDISSRAVTGLALVLHELATNAAKYGALSQPSGTIDIRWTCTADTVDIVWAERGAQIPATSSPPGFGTQLIQRSVEGQFGGKIAHDWKADGITIRMSLPSSQLM
jgi:PAS domain S-box-containing protein